MKKEEREAKKQLIEKIKERLSGIPDLKHDTAVIKAMLLINEFQTLEELVECSTLEQNGYGFNSVDGTIATSYCEQLAKKHWLSEKQLKVVRKIMKKYWKQLYELSINKYVSQNVDMLLDKWIEKNHCNYNKQIFNE